MSTKIVHTSMNSFKTCVKEFKKLSKGLCPAKGPGYYSPEAVVIGRDGQQWKKISVFVVDENGDERYELVWVAN